jgi:hypothetical protein
MTEAGECVVARRPSGGAADSGAALTATVTLALGRTKSTHRFEHVAVSTDDPDHLTVVLSSEDGRKIVVMLPRAELRRLLSWRTILDL